MLILLKNVFLCRCAGSVESGTCGACSAELLNKVTYLTPNEHEAAILFANQGKADILGRNQGKVIDLRQQRVLLMQKKGARYIMCPASRVTPVDTTGAGDTFNGAFAVARANGKSLQDSINFANASQACFIRTKTRCSRRYALFERSRGDAEIMQKGGI